MNALADAILFEYLYQEKLDNDRIYRNPRITRTQYAKWVRKIAEYRLRYE